MLPAATAAAAGTVTRCHTLALTSSLPAHCPSFFGLQVGADIVKRALPYSLKLIANNAGDNGSVVMQRVLENGNPNFGYNAATGKYEDLMAGGIIDPAKVRRRACLRVHVCAWATGVWALRLGF